jgi:hypothetical protein
VRSRDAYQTTNNSEPTEVRSNATHAGQGLGRRGYFRRIGSESPLRGASCLKQNSLRKEMGNFWTHCRAFFQEQGILARGPRTPLRTNSLTLREIARRVLALAREGIAFDRSAVLLQSPEEYRGRLEEAFARAGVPGSTSRVAPCAPILPDRSVPPLRSRGPLRSALCICRLAKVRMPLPRARRRRPRRVATVVVGICGDGCG